MSRPKIKSKNDVKEGSCFKSIPVSSGRESYVPQVTPDRHQATARKMKDKLNIATWNIRTLLQKGKLENIKQEMERMKLNILGLSEVRWKGAGKITSGGHEIIYSGGTESETGVDLFSLYSEIIMRNLENHPGIKVELRQNINNLRYADDTVLIAENKEDLQKLLNIVEEESRKKG
ncbi:craniofacial development protein 2 [Plakobranchus ocellatus]|uniref:Craniofacial development protein 2 n=1 Tax=Plakobranchus ocellatus TaxID=259542 RepID=A0AAV4AGJ8_9GAST|nr:craniofacial development protein 2 [Plakobranchus ocellatus]